MDQSIEVNGDSVESAVAAGLAQLGVGPGDVIVEVLEEPSRGVFGIGARPARVRLKMFRAAPPPPSAFSTSELDYDDLDTEDYMSTTDGDASGEDGEVGKQVLSELLDKMGLRADIAIRRSEPSRAGENAPWLLDVEGPNMNLLIGRRGDTLAALQSITRLIASRRLQRRANIIVDVAGYKSRRSQRLRQLALRMADQAVKQARTVTLEPMPPNERRIVHLALRNRTDVYTKSTGEGESRKVTIVPKSHDRAHS
jgi:spoIIIJ-associated protein